MYITAVKITFKTSPSVFEDVYLEMNIGFINSSETLVYQIMSMNIESFLSFYFLA